MFSVLRSCALVKLYKAVSCTNFWMSSRAVLAVVSWTTCAAGEGRLGRHCCTLNPSHFSAGAAYRVPDSDLDRAEPESSTECHGVMHFDIYNYHMLRHKKNRGGRGQKKCLAGGCAGRLVLWWLLFL